jgi:hypothetical protein
MRTFRAVLVGTVVSVMVGVLPLGVAAQTDGDDPADATSDPPGEVTAVGNLVYATGRAADAETELMLILVHPAGGSEDVPMVIDVGGPTVDPQALAERGVSVFLMQAPDLWSDVMLDADPTALRTMAEAVACAVRFARGSEYGSETAPLVLTGFSRHGGTAAHVALAGESFDRVWEEYHESGGGPPAQWDCTVSEGSTRVDGFVGVAGAYDNVVGYDGTSYDSPYARDWLLEHEPDLWKMLWGTVGLHPELRVRLIHGDSDSTIPFESSAAFEAVLAEAGYDVELVEFDGGHGGPPDLVLETVMELVE